MLSSILSAVIHILHQDPGTIKNGPYAVILAPTKELAEEIRQLAHIICDGAEIKYTVFTKNHIKELAVNSLLITTPDHLYKILRTKSLSLSNCSHFSLYEVDKMIEMCMEDEIVQIVSQIRSECQRLMWSRSWNGDVHDLTVHVLQDFVRLDVGTAVPQMNIAQNVKQIIKMSDAKSKKSILSQIVSLIKTQPTARKSVIFVETPIQANQITNFLRKNGFICKTLHNGRSEQQRLDTKQAFDRDEFDFLVLTDTAAKNLQFMNVSNVIQYDMPNSIIDYINRVNRTGRSPNEIGTSYAIVTEDDGHLAEDLIEILQQTKQDVNPALFILKAANADSDDEISFAVPSHNGYNKYTIDSSKE